MTVTPNKNVAVVHFNDLHILESLIGRVVDATTSDHIQRAAQRELIHNVVRDWWNLAKISSRTLEEIRTKAEQDRARVTEEVANTHFFLGESFWTRRKRRT